MAETQGWNFDDLARASTRDAFGRALVEVGRKDERVVLISADAMGSCRATNFSLEFPHRAFNFGIAEQQAVSAAAGLATCGFVPFVTTITAMLVMRSCEQVRTDIAYPRLNVKLVGISAGLSMGPGGTTHHATEDIAIMRSFANMTVLVPADAVETERAIKAAAEFEGPVYVRLGRSEDPIVYRVSTEAAPAFEVEHTRFRIGRAITLRDGSDVTLIGTGRMVAECLKAAATLETQGVSARVLDFHTIKPLDEEAVVRAASETTGIVTVEEHNVVGGLGEAVSGVVASHRPCRVVRLGVPDVFCAIGSPDELLELYGLTGDKIASAALSLLR